MRKPRGLIAGLALALALFSTGVAQEIVDHRRSEGVRLPSAFGLRDDYVRGTGGPLGAPA